MRVLLTRPQGKGDQLAQLLTPVVDFVAQQSVIEIKAGPDMSEIAAKCQQMPDILLFVSTNAVAFLQHAIGDNIPLSTQLAQHCVFIAVGHTTAKALQSWLKVDVLTPAIETSEGVLQLEQVQQEAIAGKRVVIVRGVGGRKLLAQQLSKRQAKVSYWQMYQRQAIENQGMLWWQQWQQWQIDTIVVTSVAIATAIVEGLPKQAKSWWSQLCWVCASQRIVDALAQFGVNKNLIYDAKGANNEALLRQIKIIIED